ncbi:TVP38/TMEM64 family protein [uncultured Nitrospira sp.]|uniref:TVP38/TMEM64 family protein n=1 Tax=uncultured Nitrospira sp. TaxID=157176 RepID=UPI0031408AA0
MNKPQRIFSFLPKQLPTSFWLKVGALLILIAGGYVVMQGIDVGETFRPDRITQWLSEAGPLAPVVFMGLMALAVIISPIPSLPLDIAAGAAFGPLLGAAYAVIGAEIGAITSFLIGRALGREVLTRLLHIKVTFCEKCSDQHLAIFVFLSRLVPIFSFDLISYGAGLTNMSIRVFALVTLVGMIPPTLALTYAGSYVGSGTWLTVPLGLTMVALLLLIPTLVLRYPDSRFVKLLQGKASVSTPVPLPVQIPRSTSAGSTARCDSCQGPMEC